MKMLLKKECYELLLKHVSRDLSAYQALVKAGKIDGVLNTVDEYWVDCTPAESDEYLKAAHAHFPMRSREIEFAITTAAK